MMTSEIESAAPTYVADVESFTPARVIRYVNKSFELIFVYHMQGNDYVLATRLT
jgi:hypothetical protein